MVFFRNLIVAFSLYSKIPMPHFVWEKDDMKYNLAFLPLVGAVIAALEYFLIRFALGHEVPMLATAAIASATPLLITGGFHVDGFMDTQDAFKSYKEPAEKLKILEDPHIGAFAVISLLTYSLLWTGALSLALWKSGNTMLIFFGMSFVLSRIMTGLCSLFLPKARKDGMLQNETKSSGKGCIAALVIELVACLGFLACIDIVLTLIMAAVLLIFTAYYRWKTNKEFGGVTGDTAGYFVVMSELILLVVLAAYLCLKPW